MVHCPSLFPSHVTPVVVHSKTVGNFCSAIVVISKIVNSSHGFF